MSNAYALLEIAKAHQKDLRQAAEANRLAKLSFCAVTPFSNFGKTITSFRSFVQHFKHIPVIRLAAARRQSSNSKPVTKSDFCKDLGC